MFVFEAKFNAGVSLGVGLKF